MADFIQTPRTIELNTSLAGCYQEVLSTVARVMSGFDPGDAGRFRVGVKEILRSAEIQATQLRIDARDIGLASYAAVALVDAAITTSRAPALEEWSRLTLQADLYGSSVGAETFFDSLTNIMKRPETSATADVLDLYLTCMLLGFRAPPGTEKSKWNRPLLVEKIARIRGESSELSPEWRPSQERIVTERRGWRAQIAVQVLAAALTSAAILFIAFRVLLDSGAHHFAQAVSGGLVK